MMTRLRAFGLSLLLMIAPTLGFAASNLSKLAELAATVQPGTFVELEIDGDISTCQAMVPYPLPKRHLDACDKDVEGNPKLASDHPLGWCAVPQTPWKELGNILEFTDEALWDPVDGINGEIYIMGTRRPYKRWDQGFSKYSEETNSWTILDLPPFGVGAHGYDNAALDAERREYYWSRVGAARKVWQMDLDTGTWKKLPEAPIQAGQFSAIEFFPELDKLVFFDGLGGTEYSLYDPAPLPNGNKWSTPTPLHGPLAAIQAPFGAISHFSEYNPNYGVMFFGGGYNWGDKTPEINESRRFYMLDRDQVVTRLQDAPVRLGQHGAGPLQTIDPNSGNLVVFQGENDDGTCPRIPMPIWEYDLEEGVWNQTGVHNISDLYCGMDSVVVPLYKYGVNFIVSVRNNSNCRVHLYRHSPMVSTPPSVTTQPTSQSIEEGSAVTFRVIASGGALKYQWYRNGELIAGATSVSLTIESVTVADDGAEYHSKITNNLGDAISDVATLTVVMDDTQPALESASAASATSVNLLFSEAVEQSSAENSANYALNLGINVTAASLNADKRTVSLTVSPLTEDTTYEVSVSNVQDRAQTPNTINPSSKTFTYRTIYTFDGVNPTDDWTPLNPGNWEVKTDEGDMSYYIKSSSSPGNSLLGEYSLLPGRYGDFTLTAQARLDANGANADYAIVFGFQNADDYYYALFNNNQAFIELFKVSKGTRTALELVKPVDTDWLNDNAYHAIKVSREGSEIKVYFDDNLIMHASDSTFGVGQVGIGSFNDSAYFDDVQVVGQVTTAPDDTTPPVILLTGSSVITIAEGTAYNDLGATATDNKDDNNPLTQNINVVNPVDPNSPATYTVTYNVSDAAGNAAIEVTRTVIVTAAVVIEDNEAPVIALTGNSEITIAEGSAYNDLGATATDNKDDDSLLTQNINVVNPVDPNSPATYTVTYNVSDAAGNAAIEVTRTVIVTAAVVIDDNEAPVIALTGNSEITIAEGTVYNDLGATATDNKDEDTPLTQNINVVNPVDPNSPATYTVTYNVSDAAGNAAIEVTRTVIVTAAVANNPDESSGGGALNLSFVALALLLIGVRGRRRMASITSTQL
ncbi:MAG: DUF5011 domain-containing protein [Gammaproteobacteria bacterium]|nr:DUF5011 domain-containing protein [Gammaproteobacteria bacterium]